MCGTAQRLFRSGQKGGTRRPTPRSSPLSGREKSSASTRRVGFSLVELLIALALILALTMLVAGVFRIPIQDTEETILKTNLRALRKSLQQFYNDQGRYPYNGQDEYGNIVTFLDNATSELIRGPHDGVGTYTTSPARYLLAIPVDPTTTDNTALWRLIPFDNDSDWDSSVDDVGLDCTTGTMDIGESDGEPSQGEHRVDEDAYGGGDEDGDGRTDEDPPDVRDIRSFSIKFRRL